MNRISVDSLSYLLLAFLLSSLTFAHAQEKVNAPAATADVSSAEARQNVVIRLKNISAKDCAQVMEILIPKPGATFVPDENENSLLVSAVPELLKKAEACILKLDERTIDTVSKSFAISQNGLLQQSITDGVRQKSAIPKKPVTPTGSHLTDFVVKATAAELVKRIAENEDIARKLADRIQIDAEQLGPTHPNRVQAQKEYEAIVVQIANLKKQLEQLHSKQEREIKIFRLRKGNAADYVALLKTVFRNIDANAELRTNSIVAAGTRDDLMAMEAILSNLDDSESNSLTNISRDANPMIRPPGIGFTPTNDPNQLTIAIAEHEEKAKRLGEQIRKQSAKLDDKHPEQIKMRHELEQTLTTALGLKFQLEELQLKELDARLSRMQTQFQFRKAASTKIVERRVRELVDGALLDWNPTNGSAVPSPGVAPRGASNEKSATEEQGFTIPAQQNTPQLASMGAEGMSIQPEETQIYFAGQREMEIDVGAERKQVAPLRYNFRRHANRTARFVLGFNHVPGVDWDRFAGLLDIYPADAKSAGFLKQNYVTLEFTTDDGRVVSQGPTRMKIVYLPHEDATQTRTETIDGQENRHGQDPLAEIMKRGTILVVLQIARDFAQLGVEVPKAIDEVAASAPNVIQGGGDPVTTSISSTPFFDLAAKLRAMDRGVVEATEKLKRVKALVAAAAIPAHEVVAAQRDLETAERNRKLIHEEFAATLRDLELQIDAAEATVDEATEKWARIDDLVAKKAIPKVQQLEAKSTLQQTTIALKRLKVRYDLYKKAGEGLEKLDEKSNNSGGTPKSREVQ